MKVPKTIKRYCKYCKKKTEHKVSILKTGGKRGSLKKGSIKRGQKRGLGRGYGNKGRWGSKPAKPKRVGVKTSKKPNIMFTCKECEKSIITTLAGRLKKFEFAK